jgi:hypothetical protein
MTDNLDQSSDETGASATPPADSNTDIEAVVSRILADQNANLDKRLQGFQSLFDRKIGPLSSDIEALKAVLSPEVQEQYTQTQASKELEELRQYRQMMEARQGHEEAVDFFREAMSKESFEDQIAFIEARLGSKAPAQEATADDSASQTEEPAPAVDVNNPSRGAPRLGVGAVLAQPGMDEQKADLILQAGNSKGALATLRKAMGG